MFKAKTMIIFIILVLFIASSKCSSYIILDRPDLKLNLITENKYEVALNAFKSSLNDDIIKNKIRDQYNQLEWYSIGCPQLNKIKSNEYFIFRPNEFYTEIQMLNDLIREKFKEQIQRIYNVNVSIEQIQNLELDQMNCSFEFETENRNLDLKFNGYVKSFKQYPLRLIFKYGRKLKERIEFEEAIKKYKNKTDQLDIEIDCKISLKDYNDKFTIFSKENSKSSEEFCKNEKCLEEFKNDLKSALLSINKEMFNNFEENLREINKKVGIYNNLNELKTLKGHSGWITSLVVLPNGDLVSGSGDGEIKIWNINQGQELKTLTGHKDWISSLVVLPNGDLASGSSDETIRIWNINEGKETKTLTGHSDRINSLSFLLNGDLASGSRDKTIKIWNINEGKELKTLEGHSKSIFSLVLLPNEDLACGSVDGEIKIWNINEGKELKTLTGHKDWISSLVVLPNGDLASGSFDKTIKIWNINEGKELKTLEGHSDWISSLVVLPNGDLASGSRDKTIKIWNINEGKELKTLEGHSDSIWSLVVLQNGDLASGSGDGTIKIWS